MRDAPLYHLRMRNDDKFVINHSLEMEVGLRPQVTHKTKHHFALCDALHDVLCIPDTNLHTDARVTAKEGAKHWRQDMMRRDRTAPEDKFTAHFIPKHRQLGFGSLKAFKGVHRVPVQHIPSRSRQYTSPEPVEKLHAEVLLQGEDMSTYGRLREKELFTCTREATQQIGRAHV